jgi:hypothetical protein
MTDLNQNINQAKDFLNVEDQDFKKLPQTLNVLTILTYIGCALGAIGSIWNYFTSAAAYKAYETLSADPAVSSKDNPAAAIMAGATDIVKKSYENRLPILILSLIGIALCFYGALQMRSLKKQGFLIYTVGEILPIISFAIFIGFGGLFGGFTAILTSFVAVIFIILYATQRKHLVN